MPAATGVAAASASRASSVTADDVLRAAGRIVERHGVDALTMRRLADDLGVAVTSIYWHVGNRDAVLDGLVDRLLARMETLTAQGDDPIERIASLARQLRATLLERQHLVGLAHERDRTPAMFLPVQLAMATELAAVGLTGAGAALALRSLQVHVISSVLMERAGARSASHGTLDTDLWPTDHPDGELLASLTDPADYATVFEFGLDALLEHIVTT
ncbi:MAG: TetR family transcriptional regulator [Actinobacteria bacterium]|nr:TetR family transcriptional regulator [Actinomycetota bacterium]